MSLILQPEEVESLREFVDSHVRNEGCDHTRRFVRLWAAANGIDDGELEDVLDNHGGFCDCEVVLNLPDAVTIKAAPDQVANADNLWMLPPHYEPKTVSGFTRVIVGADSLRGNNHHLEGEWAVPAPCGMKPKRRIRKPFHFFLGLKSGLPAEIAYVSEVNAISSAEFAARVHESTVDGLGLFGETEAAFILSSIASMTPGTCVGVCIADRITDRGKHQELRIHRVLTRP